MGFYFSAFFFQVMIRTLLWFPILMLSQKCTDGANYHLFFQSLSRWVSSAIGI